MKTTVTLQTCTVAEFATWLQVNGLSLRVRRMQDEQQNMMVELVSADERTAWPGVGSNWLEALQKAIDFWGSPVVAREESSSHGS